MAPSDWDQVVNLFHTALERPPEERRGLLDELCTARPSLRNAVEQLLEQHESGNGFLSEPIHWNGAPNDCASSRSAQDTFHRFILLEQLGSGGMGDVWSARDTELDRLVALKFLSAQAAWGLDTGRVGREARAASALNHPNIVTIHEVVTTGGCSAIVMEMVEGRALSKLRGTPLPISELLPIAAQIGRALAAAHASGIVHGDIKPENIMLRSDGYVKVLDFGLAHRVTPEASEKMRGPAFGTLRYLSPEQALGGPSTLASDIFAFGLVLFELSTGKHAFGDSAPAESARAIARVEAAGPSSLHSKLPPEFDSLVRRMLARDPALRPSAPEVVTQLVRIASMEAEAEHQEQTRKTKIRARTYGIAAGACVAAALAGWWFTRERHDANQFASLQIQPLTSQAGWEASPELSPDGKSIAYTWTESLDSAPELYVKALNDGKAVRLTTPGKEGSIGPVVWSHDGRWLAFKRGYSSSGAIFLIPSSGGAEKRIIDTRSPYSSSRIDWSPDGTLLAYSDFLPQSEQVAIYLSDIHTGAKRRLTTPRKDVAGDWSPKFSPDGRTIAFKQVSGFWADDMYTVPVSGGEPKRVTWDRRGIWGHAWTADGLSLLVSCQRSATVFGLWRFPLNGHSPEKVVQGGVDAIVPDICWRTGELAWLDQRQDVNIYRIPMAGAGPDSRVQPLKLIHSTVRDQDPEYSPGGSLIAFVSDRSGSREIWMARADGTEQKRVTNFNGPDLGDVQWSPDGRHLAFSLSLRGHSEIYSFACRGVEDQCDAPERLTPGLQGELPSWSADGKSIYFASNRSGRSEIWVQPVGSKQAKQVTENGGYMSRESSDGEWLYFSKIRGYGIWRVAVRKGRASEELVIDSSHRVQQKAWDLARDEIVYTARSERGKSAALFSFRISTKQTRLLLGSVLGFDDTRDYGLSISPDGKWILYCQLEESGSNIMLGSTHETPRHGSFEAACRGSSICAALGA